jgi:hypothetical protein
MQSLLLKIDHDSPSDTHAALDSSLLVCTIYNPHLHRLPAVLDIHRASSLVGEGGDIVCG